MTLKLHFFWSMYEITFLFFYWWYDKNNMTKVDIVLIATNYMPILCYMDSSYHWHQHYVPQSIGDHWTVYHVTATIVIRTTINHNRFSTDITCGFANCSSHTWLMQVAMHWMHACHRWMMSPCLMWLLFSGLYKKGCEHHLSHTCIAVVCCNTLSSW